MGETFGRMLHYNAMLKILLFSVSLTFQEDCAPPRSLIGVQGYLDKNFPSGKLVKKVAYYSSQGQST